MKTVFALVSALAVTTSTAAFAQHVDPSPYADQQQQYQSAPAEQDYRSVPGGEPKSFGAGAMPRAFYDQEQPGYPQSPPGGGE
jgi:hypothetical protein